MPAHLDLAKLGFWTLEQPMAAVDLTLNYLRVGTLDGRVATTITLHWPGNGPMDLSLQPQPVGPAGGRVLYVADDAHKATVHAVSVASGADTALGTTPAFIASMAIDPTGSTAYVAGLDRSSGAFVEVDAMPTVGGRPRSIIRTRDLGPDSTTSCSPVAGLGYSPRLAVSNDGRWVVLASFRPSGCGLVAAPTNGGTLREWPAFAIDEQIVGIAGDLLIGSTHSCEQFFCDGFVIDLRTGVRSPLGGSEDMFDPIQLIAGPHGPLVLGQVADDKAGNWRVEALDLTDRTRSFVFAATFKPIDYEVRLAEWPQAELPAGWFLISRNSTGAPPPEPQFSAGAIGGKTELPLPIMTIPKR